MKETIISASALSRTFESGGETVWAVNEVDLQVEAGELLVFTGRSGSGKTTLLNLLSGLDRPSSGSALFQGADLARMPEKELVALRRRKIGFVFQSFGLMPLLSAQENVELPLHIIGVSWRERRRRAQEALESVGLGPARKASALRAVRGRAAAGINCQGAGHQPGSGVRRRAHRRAGHHNRPLHNRHTAPHIRRRHDGHRRHPRPLPGRSRGQAAGNGRRPAYKWLVSSH